MSKIIILIISFSSLCLLSLLFLNVSVSLSHSSSGSYFKYQSLLLSSPFSSYPIFNQFSSPISHCLSHQFFPFCSYFCQSCIGLHHLYHFSCNGFPAVSPQYPLSLSNLFFFFLLRISQIYCFLELKKPKQTKNSQVFKTDHVVKEDRDQVLFFSLAVPPFWLIPGKQQAYNK